MSEALLEVRGLDVHYGDAQALWSVDLTVGPGETVAVVGPNGAGKSTLVNAIAGLQPRSAREILVAGTDVSRMPAHRVCTEGVAIVPEGRRVFAQMTVADNLALGAYRPAARREHRAILASLAEGATVEEILRDFPTLRAEDVRAVIAFAAASAQEDLPTRSTSAA